MQQIYKTRDRTIEIDQFHNNIYNIFDQDDIFVGSIMDTTFNALVDAELVTLYKIVPKEEK